jgi:hypothetical protein
MRSEVHIEIPNPPNFTNIGRLKKVLLKDLNIDQKRCSHADWGKLSDEWKKILCSEDRADVGIITSELRSETFLDTDLNKAVFYLGIKTSASHSLFGCAAAWRTGLSWN